MSIYPLKEISEASRDAGSCASGGLVGGGRGSGEVAMGGGGEVGSV